MTTRRILIAAALTLVACSPEATTSPDLQPSYAKGGSGGGQPSGSTGIVAIQLGAPKSLGCSSTSAAAVNDAPVTVVGGYCSVSLTPRPFVWSSAGASVLPDTGDVLEVTAAGATVGRLDFRPYYRDPGSAPIYLPMTTGMQWGEVLDITPSGTFAVGSVSSESITRGALWTRSGGVWTIAELSSGIPAGVSADGAIMVGRQNGRAAVWTNSGTWTAAILPDGGAFRSRAIAVNQTGTVIVGERYVPLQSNPAIEVDQHVAWIADGSGNWTLQVLGGLNILEGAAHGVATQLDGSVVAVGGSWEDRPGKGGQHWAVAWHMPVGASAFNPPVKLNPVSSGQTAEALDVNSKGEIVGYSYTRISTVAVMWKLP